MQLCSHSNSDEVSLNIFSLCVRYNLLFFSNWYGAPRNDIDLDDKNEPTAADHGDVLYNIGKSDTIGRYMVARRNIHPGEVVFTDQPAVIGRALSYIITDDVYC